MTYDQIRALVAEVCGARTIGLAGVRGLTLLAAIEQLFGEVEVRDAGIRAYREAWAELDACDCQEDFLQQTTEGIRVFDGVMAWEKAHGAEVTP